MDRARIAKKFQKSGESLNSIHNFCLKSNIYTKSLLKWFPGKKKCISNFGFWKCIYGFWKAIKKLWLLQMHFHGFCKCISMNFANGFPIYANAFPWILQMHFQLLQMHFHEFCKCISNFCKCISNFCKCICI